MLYGWESAISGARQETEAVADCRSQQYQLDVEPEDGAPHVVAFPSLLKLT